MTSLLKRFMRKKFVRNVAIVATGTAGAQATTIAFSPVITRLYGPEAFGILGTFTAILVVFTPLAALSYPLALVLPKRDSDAIGLAKLSLSIAVVMSLLTTLALLLFKGSIVKIFELEKIEPFILLLPVAMFFSAVMVIIAQWVIRKKLFKIKAKVAVLQALWLNGAKAGAGLIFPAASILIILATIGSALHALMLWTETRKNKEGRMAVKEITANKNSATDFKSLAWRYRDFAYYRTPQTLLSALSQSMPVLMLASLFGPTVAGFYTLSRMVLGVPSRLIGQSVADVFYPKFVEILQEGKSGKNAIAKTSISLLAIGSLPYLIIIAIGPSLFSFVFSDEWSMAGQFSQWMAVWLLTVLASRPVISAIPALGLQHQFLIFEILSFGIRVAAIFLGYLLSSSAIITIAFFSIANAGAHLILIVLVVRRA